MSATDDRPSPRSRIAVAKAAARLASANADAWLKAGGNAERYADMHLEADGHWRVVLALVGELAGRVG